MNAQKTTIALDEIKHIKRLLVAIGHCHSAINKRSKSIAESLEQKNNISTARWQVMSAVIATDKPTISKVARGLKSTRQNISILVEAMVKDNIVVLCHNPDHKRAKILQLTYNGKLLFSEVSAQRDIWCHDMQGDVTNEDLQTTRDVLIKLTHRLEQQ